jgi:hypothetical protein
MKKRNQNGIATVEIILFVIIFVIIGFIGWYVMKQDKDNRDLSDQAIKTSASTPLTKSQPSIGKFVFKELGVQFDLPADLKGLSYKAEQITETNGEKNTALYLYVATDDIKNTITKCYGKDESVADSLNFGAISKINGQYKEPGANDGPTDPLLKQFDTFYVLGSFPNGITNCSESGVDESLVHNTASKLNTSFTSSFKKTATKVQ